jgi:ferritin
MFNPLADSNTESPIWSLELQELVNKHIGVEFSNFTAYEKLSSVMSHGSNGFSNLAKHFREEADEELKHTRLFIDYQNRRGGTVNVTDVPNIDITPILISENKVIAAYKFALELEKKTYNALKELHEKCNDPQLQDFIETMLEEQLDTQKKINDIVQRLEMGGSTATYIHETIELKPHED